MTYTITYSVKNTMKVFTDVVEAKDINDAEVELKKMVAQFTNKPVQIILIK